MKDIAGMKLTAISATEAKPYQQYLGEWLDRKYLFWKHRGTIRWKIPFGEYPELAAKGMKNTGTDNYGGPVVTANGLLFIGATSWDRKFHAYDKLTGKLLWETVLPFAGAATPSLYMVDGREYVVIVCGGGKNGAPSGGSIVAFALPR